MISQSKPVARLFQFKKDTRGNVLMIMGFALIPITMAAGMTVDYTRAARLKTKLDAAADAAVLSAVATGADLANDRTVCERAAELFHSQARGIPQIAYSKAGSITLTVGSQAAPINTSYVGGTDSCSAPAGSPSSAASRVISLSYSVASQNIFGALFSTQTMPVTGRASAESSIAPNVDFYVALDTSPSMALPVDAAGITAMTSTTGCTFACHTNKAAAGAVKDNATFALNKSAPRTAMIGANSITYIDALNTYVFTGGKKDCVTPKKGAPVCVTDINVYNSDGSYVDTYWYTRNKGITLRIDELRRATSDLVTTALFEADKNGATYRAAIYAFDYEANFRKIHPATAGVVTIAEKTPSSATIANGVAFKAVASSTAVELAKLDDITGNGCPAVGCTPSNRYLFTSYRGLFDGMQANGNLPAVGGSGTPSDTPQAILFVVTDGMSGEKASLVDGVYSNDGSGPKDRTRSEMSGALPSPSNPSHLAKCNAIKARNVRIAILYTEYTAASIASDSAGQRAWVMGRIPLVEGKLRDCASPGLMLKVSTGSDISGALSALFRKAVTTPRLVR